MFYFKSVSYNLITVLLEYQERNLLPYHCLIRISTKLEPNLPYAAPLFLTALGDPGALVMQHVQFPQDYEAVMLSHSPLGIPTGQ